MDYKKEIVPGLIAPLTWSCAKNPTLAIVLAMMLVGSGFTP